MFHVERTYVALCWFVKLEYCTRTKKFLAQSGLVTALQRTCSLNLQNVGKLLGRNVLTWDVWSLVQVRSVEMDNPVPIPCTSPWKAEWEQQLLRVWRVTCVGQGSGFLFRKLREERVWALMEASPWRKELPQVSWSRSYYLWNKIVCPCSTM